MKDTIPDGSALEDDVPWWHVEIGPEERNLVDEALAKNLFSQGPVVRKFESELAESAGAAFAVCTTSGSTALLMSMMALGVGPGDRVIVPTRTFIATAHAAHLLGASVDLVDCRADLPVVNAALIEEKVTDRTKAILPVHLNGRSADIETVMAIADRRGIAVVEDAAQGVFSRAPDGRHLGTLGDMGCYSFGMTKLVSCGQGGAVVTNREDLYERLSGIRNHGVEDTVSHESRLAGCNFKYSDLLASMGLSQLRGREEKIRKVNQIYRRYAAALEGISGVDLVPVNISVGEVPLWVEVVSSERDRIMARLAENGIQSRKFVPCVHTAPHFKREDAFPNSERFRRQGFILPCGPDQPLDNVERVIDVLLRL